MDCRKQALFAVFTTAVFTGCAYEQPSAVAQGIDSVRQPIVSSTDQTNGSLAQDAAPLSGQLELEQAQQIAMEQNLTFQEFAANLAAARAEMLEAIVYPNPEIEGTLGNAHSREPEGGDEVEFGMSIVQPIEMPSKRRTRREAAAASVPVAEEEVNVFRQTLRAEVAKAFWTVAFQDQAIEVAEENARIAQEVQDVVSRRVEGGEAPEIDLIKARVETLKANRTVQMQKRRRAAAGAALSALLGGVLPDGFQIAGELAASLPAVDLVTAREAINNHPALRVLEARRRQQEAVLAREKAAWHPDLRPGLFSEREADADTFGVTLGLTIPLFNRNQGGIARSKAELDRLAAEMNRTRIDLDRRIHEAWQAHESAREQVEAYQSGLREQVAEALRIETFLYEQGETSFLQLLDARRTARETEAEYLQAIFDARISRAELEQAMGMEGIEP